MYRYKPHKEFILKKRLVKYIILLAALIFIMVFWNQIFSFLNSIWNLISPLVLGCAMAYILNIIMTKLEKIYFPDSKNDLINKTKPFICLILSIIIILIIILIVVTLLVPEFIKAISEFAKTFPIYLNKVNAYFKDSNQLPIVSETLKTIQLDWNNIINSITTYATKGVTGIFSFVGNFTSAVVSFFLAFTFMIYLLLNKEMVFRQIGKLTRAFLKQSQITLIKKFIVVANECFSSFIVGQCTEAVILGSLCTLGMIIFRFPFALAIGACVGITALIPIFGAYIGTIIGAFLILTVDPLKALLFIVYILVLQQLENNFIYPKVVGTSIGLPGIWVFAAITIGAGFGGIAGMLVSVPLAATVYKLLRISVNEKLGNS